MLLGGIVMKRIICLVLACMTVFALSSCAEADAIKNGIKDKLPKPEEHEIVEAIMEKPIITDEYEHSYSLLVVQEYSNKTIIAVVDGSDSRYSIPSWFGDTELTPGTYVLVEHADNSLPTNPMQFGFIYSMKYLNAAGSIIEGIKP
jgi:hypothetical protein